MAQDQGAPPGAAAGDHEPGAPTEPAPPSGPATPTGPVTTTGPASSTEPPATASPAAPGTRPDRVPWLIAAVVFAVYTTISVFRYLRMDPGSWDLGIYTEYVRQLAGLHAPVVTIKGAGFNLLGDHFQPIVALIAPFYRVFPTPVTLLVAQALLTAISVIPVCRAARELLGTGASRVIGAAYGASWGLQQMIIFDFHEIAFAVPLIAFSLSALVRRRPWAAAAWALPLVFAKEDQGLTVAAIGLVMLGMAAAAWWQDTGPAPEQHTAPAPEQHTGPAPEPASRAAGPWTAAAGPWAIAGGLLVIWGLGWSALAIEVIIPHFNPAHHYPYWFDGGVLAPGGHHFSVSGLLKQFTHAGTQKLRTTFMLLLPVAFLALRSPLAVIAVPTLVLRFLATNNSYWGTDWHYNSTLMPIVFLAAIDALARIQANAARRAQARAAAHGQAQAAWAQAGPAARPPPATPGSRGRYPLALRAGRYAAAVMAAIAVVLAFRFPLSDVWKPRTYDITAHARADRAAVAAIPPGSTVVATLSLLAPLATRDTTYWIGTSGKLTPPYLVFDGLDSGYSPAPRNVPAFITRIYPDLRFQKIFEADDVYVFRFAGRNAR
ncbi:MAG TPA: DUF2079 domain-containing protein [Streptosporangiaceae bacterium]